MTNLSRRNLIKGAGALSSLTLLGPLAALQARAAARETLLIDSPYGPLLPAIDQSTGLPLLRLPRGFSYASFGWSGDRMMNGLPCPGLHDGMGVVSTRGDKVILIRNHEVGLGKDVAYFGAESVYDRGQMVGQYANGGTTQLRFRDGKWLDMRPALGGTLANCAGGVTPWGTWLTCEEVGADDASSTGMKHGYVFEVRPDAPSSVQPIVGMGRFRHEAVAVDPTSGIVYMTEDDAGKSGFYRYLPRQKHGRPGSLAQGGTLQMARIAGDPNASIAAAKVGQTHPLEWVDILAPDADRGPAVAGGKSIDNASGPFRQGWSQGALRMNRGEGIAYHQGKVYVMDTTGGEVKAGAIWELDLDTQIMRCVYASRGMLFGDMGDNITVSPRGGLLMCEDASSTAIDEYGPGERLMGLTSRGEIFIFAKNNYEVDADTLRRVGKAPEHAGDRRASEFCGACFDATGKFLFVNAQDPGITYAITGPWQQGPL
jgi:hypothetical protein